MERGSCLRAEQLSEDLTRICLWVNGELCKARRGRCIKRCVVRWETDGSCRYLSCSGVAQPWLVCATVTLLQPSQICRPWPCKRWLQIGTDFREICLQNLYTTIS